MSDLDISAIGRPYEDYVEQQRTPKQNLGQNDFLALLSAQLRYQDPMEPMKDTAFVAQLAQFSQLSSLENLGKTMELYQSYNLAGKFVYGTYTDENGTLFEVIGIVDRIFNVKGVAYAEVEGRLVKVSDITEVYDSNLLSSKNPLLEYTALIGKTATANIPSEKEGEDHTTITGIVTRVAVDEKEGLVAYLKYKNAAGEIVEAKVRTINIVDVKESDGTIPEQTEPEVKEDPPVTEPEETPAGDEQEPPVPETEPTGEQPE